MKTKLTTDDKVFVNGQELPFVEGEIEIEPPRVLYLMWFEQRGWKYYLAFFLGVVFAFMVKHL